MTLLPQPQTLRIDVGDLVRESVASLYSHLVTRPTGRAVRLAIESRVAEVGEPSISVVDFSQVTILDFSCADEVVARLLRRYQEVDRPREAFFLFRGIQEWHEEPIQAVLERQSLAAVAQGGDGATRLLGTVSDDERAAWERLESVARIAGDGLAEVFADPRHLGTAPHLVDRRLAFRSPAGDLLALSGLAG